MIAVMAPLTIPIPIDFILALSACAMTLAILDWKAGPALRVLSALRRGRAVCLTDACDSSNRGQSSLQPQFLWNST